MLKICKKIRGVSPRIKRARLGGLNSSEIALKSVSRSYVLRTIQKFKIDRSADKKRSGHSIALFVLIADDNSINRIARKKVIDKSVCKEMQIRGAPQVSHERQHPMLQQKEQ